MVGSQHYKEECCLLERYTFCGYFGAGWLFAHFPSNLLVLPGSQRPTVGGPRPTTLRPYLTLQDRSVLLLSYSYGNWRTLSIVLQSTDT